MPRAARERCGSATSTWVVQRNGAGARAINESLTLDDRHRLGIAAHFGFARMMTWLSLTTIEKSTPLDLYCSMIFGAWALIVFSSLP